MAANRSYISEMNHPDRRYFFSPPQQPLDEESTKNLKSSLSACPDVAFAHLVDVRVEGVDAPPSLSLFVWLVPVAVRSLRGSLNLLSETVAGAIPRDRFVDVLILNSAPELLEDVERAGCLFVERDLVERRRALEAVEGPADG